VYFCSRGITVFVCLVFSYSAAVCLLLLGGVTPIFRPTFLVLYRIPCTFYAFLALRASNGFVPLRPRNSVTSQTYDEIRLWKSTMMFYGTNVIRNICHCRICLSWRPDVSVAFLTQNCCDPHLTSFSIYVHMHKHTHKLINLFSERAFATLWRNEKP
jgi:hypothetical protein